MEQNVEYGKLTRITKNFLFGIRYVSYYSKKQDQWYLLDLGLNSLWLGFFCGFAPLLFKYIPIKAYPIEEKDIEEINNNKILQFWEFLILILSLLGSINLMHQYLKNRRLPIGVRVNGINDFFANHVILTLVLWLICSITIICIVSLIKPINLDNRKYKKIKIIATFNFEINKAKIIFKNIIYIFIYITLSIYFFFYGKYKNLLFTFTYIIFVFL